MTDDVHRQIARKARERGWLSESDIVDIMLELGEALNEQESVDVSEWSERGWLTKTQLLDVLGELQRPEGTASDDETFDHEDQPETQNYVRGPVGADESGIDEAESDAATDPTEGAAPFETQEAVPPRTNEGSSDATQWDRELTPTSSLDGDGLEEYTESQPDDDTLTSIPDSLLEGDVAPLDLGSSLGEESTSSDT
ncbi:MAG: hypothetical protein ABEL76_05515, partial [Bradymonadaceae bacterium]